MVMKTKEKKHWESDGNKCNNVESFKTYFQRQQQFSTTTTIRKHCPKSRSYNHRKPR